MKRLLACALALSLGLFTLGCGGDSGKKPTTPAKPPETKPGASAPTTPATPPAAPSTK